MSGPPRWSERLLGRLLPAEAAEEIIGDLREEWERAGSRPGRYMRHALATLSVAWHFLSLRRPHAEWWSHFRLALRRLRREPTFSAVAVGAIALGIGVNVLMLAIADTVLFSPLPYPDEDRLAVLSNDHTGSSTGGFGVAYPNIRDVRARVRGIESTALYLDWQDVAYQTEDGAIRLPAAFVSEDYTRLLGLEAALGRFFTPDENRENDPAHVVVLGQGTWRSVFGADPKVVGRTLTLNGRPYEVIGVSDDDRGDLRYLWGQDPVGVYLPLFSVEELIGFDLDGGRGDRYLNGLVRLRQGTSVDEARSELAAIASDLAREFPRTNEGWSYSLQPLDEAMYEQLRTPTSAVLGISMLVFVLVGVNLLTLILLRAAGRGREVAVRLALGAGRARILGQLSAESVVLAAVGWVLGTALAAWGLEVFSASEAVRLPESATLALDVRVLIVSAGAAAALALLLGLAPALALLRSGRANRADLLHAGKGSAGARRVRMQGALVAAEVALACVLLVGAGLMLESFRTLRGTGHGFDTDRLLLVRVDVRNAGFGADERIAFARDLERQSELLTGAEDAFVWSPNRLGHGNQVSILTAEGRFEIAPEERIEASLHTLHPGTLQSLGMRLLRGRDVADSDDADSPRVALISESLARALWPGEDPVGRRVSTPQGGGVLDVEVVGVVADARHRTRLIEPFEAQRDIYYPYAQTPRGVLTVAVRYAEGASVQNLVDGVRAVVRESSPSAPVFGVTTMAERMRSEEGPARLGAVLVALYAVLAVSLAALGLYGVLAHGVQLQLREIGIRKALGADRASLMSRVVGRGMAMAVAGLAVGVALAIPGAHLLQDALYGVEPGAAHVYVIVLGALALVALASCAIPASRAVRVAPSDVLRAE